jgi:protein-tyrosine phosphatase
VRRPGEFSTPEFGLYLLGRRPEPAAWASRWVRWPDFGLPLNWPAARAAVFEVWQRSAESRVEVACAGGRGRTGTVLACLAALDGLAPGEAIAYVREHYAAGAVETPWQRWFVTWFAHTP